mgnify:CR=1 FL=1
MVLDMREYLEQEHEDVECIVFQEQDTILFWHGRCTLSVKNVFSFLFDWIYFYLPICAVTAFCACMRSIPDPEELLYFCCCYFSFEELDCLNTPFHFLNDTINDGFIPLNLFFTNELKSPFPRWNLGNILLKFTNLILLFCFIFEVDIWSVDVILTKREK